MFGNVIQCFHSFRIERASFDDGFCIDLMSLFWYKHSSWYWYTLFSLSHTQQHSFILEFSRRYNISYSIHHSIDKSYTQEGNTFFLILVSTWRPYFPPLTFPHWIGTYLISKQCPHHLPLLFTFCLIKV